MRSSLITLLLGALVCSPILHAKAPESLKIEPGALGEGPALFFSRGHSNPDTKILFAFSPGQDAEPRALWRGFPRTPDLLRRLSRQVMLVDFGDRLHLVNTAAGTATPLLDVEDPSVLVAEEDKTIYFLRQTVPDTDLGSVSLTTGKDQKTVVEGYHRGRDILFRYDLKGEGGAQPVSPLVIERFLAFNDDGFWVITADQPREVVRIGREGSTTSIMPYDVAWLAGLTTHSFSPTSGYLALAVLHRDQDFHSERTLVVCDLKAKRVCFTDRNIPLGPDLFSGRAMFLEMGWKGPAILQYGGPFSSLSEDAEEADRFVDVRAGRRLEKAATAKFQRIAVEELPKRERRGSFELAFGLLFFAGEDQPVASVLDNRGVAVREIEISADGKWAAYCDPANNNVYVIDGEAKEKRRICSGPCHEMTWLSVESGR